MSDNETIAALSSPTGPAARIIIRVSGPHALPVARSLCDEQTFPPASARYTSLSFANLRCPAWVYSFHSPRSYTGEDLIEFHLPGSPVLAKLLLDDLFNRGIRLAEPGEFTARAYFAGKLDLTEAEGVAATIAAGNEHQLQAARQLLAGELARRLRPTMDLITQTLALVEVGIDFSEEDVTILPIDEMLRRFEQIDTDLTELLDDSSRFEELSNEPRIVLAGRPNAGKSTLLNTLTGQPRAVVSDVAGTTRDILTAELALPHGKIQLIDAAGVAPLNPAHNHIDRLMQQQSLQAVETADRLVIVRDATDLEPPLILSRQPDLIVLSKCDLLPTPPVPDHRQIPISAKTGLGLSTLLDALDRLAFARESSAPGLALNRRHIAAIEEARCAVARAGSSTHDPAGELIALELREALDALGRVLGIITPDDVLTQIFSQFCIGK